MRQIVLDTETTGLSPAQGHRIIEIAGIELDNRQLTGRHFHQYVKVDRDIDPGAQKVHGITREFLQDKPHFLEIVDEFIEFIDGAELIIHNAPFDVGFLDNEFTLLTKKVGPTQKYCQVLDTLALARKMHPGQRNSLDALCKRYDIDNSGRDLHGALIDADLLALTYLAMTSGQENLFGEEQKKTEVKRFDQNNVESLKKQLPNNFKIIRATKEELVAHNQRMKTITDNSNMQF